VTAWTFDASENNEREITARLLRLPRCRDRFSMTKQKRDEMLKTSSA